MKKLIVGIIFSIILMSICHAQKPYSHQNLSQASNDSLEILLDNALDLKRSGLIVSIIGAVTCLTGSAVYISAEYLSPSKEDLVVDLVKLGALFGLSGIPIIKIGSTRVKRTKSYMTGSPQVSSVKLTPCTLNYNFGNQVCPGIRFTITF